MIKAPTAEMLAGAKAGGLEGINSSTSTSSVQFPSTTGARPVPTSPAVPSATAPKVPAPTVPASPTSPTTPTTPETKPTSYIGGLPEDEWYKKQEELRKQYGLSNVPEYKQTIAPSEEVNRTAAAAFNPEEIKRNLDLELNAIRQKYALERQDVETKTENERMAQISNLYNVGYVNPASSGLSSIGTASTDIKDKRMAALRAAESAETTKAMQDAYQLSSDAAEKQFQFAKGERSRVEDLAQEKYQGERQQWADVATQVNNIVTAVKNKQAVSKTDQDQSQLHN